MPDEFDAYRHDFDEIEHRVQREFNTGGRAVTIAILVVILAVAMLFPLAESARAWTILTAEVTTDAPGSFFLRIFIVLAVVGGIGGSLIALVTHRWAAAWATMFSQGLGVLFGMFALWAELTAHPQARTPSVALYIAFGATLALAYLWIRVVTNTTNIMKPVRDYGDD
ncbi:hypothetical protein GCM10011410_14150 [Hoyosella rhizosphaerae]|uniref:Uncharacterized protein n=2 Tax=Hoyosella rhizosphaerae TaxID=1755582 RepID=A0A916U6Y8_9ACTN|nr:hypothetical protein GCM10011410_14150 [Hoyosella rhizosphaerae]